MLGLAKLARLVRWFTRYRKYLAMVTMALCLALSCDAVANNAVFSWTSIGLTFLANGCMIPVTILSMIPKLPKSTKLLCCFFGGVLYFCTNVQVYEAWSIKYDLMNRMPFEAQPVQVEGVRQLYLVSMLCQLIAYMFALDFCCTCFMAQPKPEPEWTSRFPKRPLDTVSFMRIQQLRDFKR